MNHFGLSGVFPVCGCIFLVAVCVFILWASEHEEDVKTFAWRVVACLAAIILVLFGSNKKVGCDDHY